MAYFLYSNQHKHKALYIVYSMLLIIGVQLGFEILVIPQSIKFHEILKSMFVFQVGLQVIIIFSID